VVYGFGGEAVPQALADDKLTFVLQAEQHGTGHAVKQALPKLADDSVTLVLYGDVPLTHTRTLQPLVAAAQAGKLGLLTVNLAQPDGLWAHRPRRRQSHAHLEHKDATPAERAIQEVNTGNPCRGDAPIEALIAELKNEQRAGRVLLDRHHRAGGARRRGGGNAPAGIRMGSAGVNSKAQLAQLERIPPERDRAGAARRRR